MWPKQSQPESSIRFDRGSVFLWVASGMDVSIRLLVGRERV